MMHAAEWFGCGCGAVPLCAWGHWRQSMMMILSLVILRALMEQLQVSRSQVLGQEFENAMISLCTGRSYYVFIMFYQFNTETLVIMTKISSSCTLRTCEASHGGKHCDSVGEDQTCYRSEFARAEGMVVAQHQFFFLCVLYSSLKTEKTHEKSQARGDMRTSWNSRKTWFLYARRCNWPSSFFGLVTFAQTILLGPENPEASTVRYVRLKSLQPCDFVQMTWGAVFCLCFLLC